MSASPTPTRSRSRVKLPVPGLAFWLFTIIGLVLGFQFDEYTMWVAFGMVVGLGMDIALRTAR